MIAVEKLSLVLPSSLVFEMQGCLERFEINTALRSSHFIAQIKHESGDFKRVEENLNYKSAERLAQIFRADFDADKDKVIDPEEIEFAKKYVGQPERIANFVYANQNGNGNEASGDGWRFRGRGYMQTTGRANYRALALAMNDETIMLKPEILATPKYACLSAGYFWGARKLNALADQGNTVEIVKAITKIINGGYNGLEDRIHHFGEIYTHLNAE